MPTVASGDRGLGMNIYVESSALLAWLFGEAASSAVLAVLDASEALVTSDLTLVECDRALHRAVALGALDRADATDIGARFAAAQRAWNILRITPEIAERARQSFPDEPIRTLDALHIASALQARGALPTLALLSLDNRIRKVGASLGFALLPS